MLQKIGFITICIGTAFANSDCLLVPFGIVALGAFLIWNGLGKGDNDETA